MGALEQVARKLGRAKGRPPSKARCSHCGGEAAAEEVLHCDECLFVYCREHATADLHLCAVVCAECPDEDDAN